MTLLSVKCLFESTVYPEDRLEKMFEERIYLVPSRYQAELFSVLSKKMNESPYKNAVGTMTAVKLVDILDVFECIDQFSEQEAWKEVYSRYLIVEGAMTANDVIHYYHLKA